MDHFARFGYINFIFFLCHFLLMTGCYFRFSEEALDKNLVSNQTPLNKLEIKSSNQQIQIIEGSILLIDLNLSMVTQQTHYFNLELKGSNDESAPLFFELPSTPISIRSGETTAQLRINAIENTNLSGDIQWTLTFKSESSEIDTSTAFTFTLMDNDSPSNQWPTALLTGLPSELSNSQTTNISVSGINLVNYQYKLGPTLTTICSFSGGYSTDLSSSLPIIENLGVYSDGQMTLCVIGKDANGNKQPYSNSSTHNWLKDTEGPSKPGAISIGSLPDLYKLQTPLFSFTASSDSQSGLESYQIEIRKASDNSIVKSYTTASGDHSGLKYYSESDLFLGGESYYVNLRAQDYAGNFSESVQSENWLSLECPTHFVAVPARSPYTTLPFCVSKYEIKLKYNGSIVADGNASNTHDYDLDYETQIERQKYAAVSDPNGLPWVHIKRGDYEASTGQGAIQACQNMGTGFDLISNSQWQSIAQNAELISSNWTSGVVGSEMMFRGHSDILPNAPLSVGTIEDDYDQTSNNQIQSWGSGKEQRRTLKLSNGEVIWDLAGNVWEWLKDNNTKAFESDTWISQLLNSNLTTGTIGGLTGNAKYLFGPFGDYSSLSTGQYGGLGHGWVNSNAGAILRGGFWYDHLNSGLFFVNLSYSPSIQSNAYGFRCVYQPTPNLTGGIIHLGDAVGRPTLSNPNIWQPFWTNSYVSISHKSDFNASIENWTPVQFNSLGVNNLTGGDLINGSLGVSGRVLPTSGYYQEIHGTETLRFDLTHTASRVTLNLSLLFEDDDDNLSQFNEAGRIQALNAGGNVIDEIFFVANSSTAKKSVTFQPSQPFTSLVINAGSQNNSVFEFGAYANDSGAFATTPYIESTSLHGSDFLIESITFELTP